MVRLLESRVPIGRGSRLACTEQHSVLAGPQHTSSVTQMQTFGFVNTRRIITLTVFRVWQYGGRGKGSAEDRATTNTWIRELLLTATSLPRWRVRQKRDRVMEIVSVCCIGDTLTSLRRIR